MKEPIMKEPIIKEPIKVQDTEVFSLWDSWLKEQRKNPGNVLLIHDADGDGICAGKLLKEGLGKQGIKVKFRFAAFDRTGLFSPFLMDFIEKHGIQSIVTADINFLHTNYRKHQELLQDKTIIVFDHHETPSRSGVPGNMIYIHPATMFGFPAPSQYCTSKLVYDILSLGTDMSDLNWAASIGIVSDAAYSTWKDFVDGTLHELGMALPASPYDSELQRIGTLLYYGLAMERKEAQKAVNALFAARNYKEAIQKLEKYAVVGDEVEDYLTRWEEFAEFHGDIVFIVLESKYKINSLISSKLSFQEQGKTFVVASPSRREGKKSQESGEEKHSGEEGQKQAAEKKNVEEKSSKEERFMNMSLRRQDNKVNLPALLQEISSQVEGFVGGGHIPAAGARCKLEDYQRVKDLLVKQHGKWKS